MPEEPGYIPFVSTPYPPVMIAISADLSNVESADRVAMVEELAARWVQENEKGGSLTQLSREEFIALREARDATLALPKLILPSVQFNIRGKQPLAPESNG